MTGPTDALREHECTACGRVWSARVEGSTTSQNLSGEPTPWCPDCGHRAAVSSPVWDNVEAARRRVALRREIRRLCPALASLVNGSPAPDSIPEQRAAERALELLLRELRILHGGGDVQPGV